jgi:UDP-N-acetylglucosamine 2-epimerase
LPSASPERQEDGGIEIDGGRDLENLLAGSAKMGPVVKALRKRPDFEAVVCSTGQQRQLLDHALAIFGIKPDIVLNVMTPDQTLSRLTATVISALDPVV